MTDTPDSIEHAPRHVTVWTPGVAMVSTHGSVCVRITGPGTVEARGDARLIGALRLALRRSRVKATGG